MGQIEVSRTLIKSPPELWEELKGDRLAAAVGGEVTVHPTEPEKELAWQTAGAAGKAMLEPAGFGTKVTLTAEVEEQVSELGWWARNVRGDEPAPPRHPDIEQRLESVLDDLGAAHHKPFVR